MAETARTAGVTPGSPVQDRFFPLLTPLLAAPLIAAFARLGINFLLHRAGYFYGIPWDTFTRTAFSYSWSQQPFLFTPDGYWLPLQFWITGAVFKLIYPRIPTIELLVPAAINFLFFTGSLFVAGRFARRIGGNRASLLTCLLAALFAGDVFATYSGLSEPILIFFMLWTSDAIYQLVVEENFEPGPKSLVVAMPAALAAATHYIGWFLAVFAGMVLLRSLLIAFRRKDWRGTGWLVLAFMLCVLIPLAWLLNSYLRFGDLFYSFHFAHAYQSDYIGNMPVWQRIQTPIRVLLTHFPAVTLLGGLSLAAAFTTCRRSLVFAAGPAFMLGVIWLSTALAYSAPYQEPRYLVFWGWATLPFIAIFMIQLWNRPALGFKLLSGLAGILFLVSNLYALKNFSNSFGQDVQAAAGQAQSYLAENPDQGRVILETIGFEEQTVIPVTSGYPWKFQHISTDTLREHSADLAAYFTSYSPKWLAVLKTRKLARLARVQGFTVIKLGRYFLVSP